MSLTPQEVNEVGEALNAALASNVISQAVRDKLVLDVRGLFKTPVDATMIAAVQVTKKLGLYVDSLDAYLAQLGGTQTTPPTPPAPVAPPVTPPVVIPPPAPDVTPEAASRFHKVVAKTFTLENEVEEVVDITLTGNNEHPQRVGRLRYGFKGSYPAEIEIEPGPDIVAKGNIISQVMQWGPRTKDGKNRNRLTVGVYADANGGLAGVIDSSTNDPSGSAGQALSMPVVVNVGEAKGVYVVINADGRVKMKHGATEVEKTIEEWVK